MNYTKDHEPVIKWIINERKRLTPWESISTSPVKGKELTEFLDLQASFNHWPAMSAEEWQAIVNDQRRQEEEKAAIYDEAGKSITRASNETNGLAAPEADDSAWQTYREKLLAKGMSDSTVNRIEATAVETLKSLSRDTRSLGSVKGLVVGNVQSGKTANMAALMAMAADHGWNMFIILSGMMNNLKDQTSRRVISDLSGSRWVWQSIDNPAKDTPYPHKLNNLNLNEGSKYRYLTVCIKNGTRLKNLLNWLNGSPEAKEKLRILIIDDEADQASINTKTKGQRSAINNLLLDLVHNRDSKHRATPTSPESVNYVGYTATPYANVLNEGGRESLYPKDFINALPVSEEYFGPQQIFGCDELGFPGLNIIREIDDDSLNIINSLHNADFSGHIPQELEDALCWFICGIAAMRLSDYQKPISMLVHTSRDTLHHKNIYDAILHWFATTSKASKLQLCETIWNKEIRELTPEEFRKGYPSYSHLESIQPLPSFDLIRPEIEKILDKGLQNIKVCASTDKRYEYSDGINICVDNSAPNDDDKTQLRLMYPEEDEMPKVAPAFLVIGGNTLSRGLTIEGLLSSFFVRPARCSDTLMQMGRFFGYRRGYELLPRIWMPTSTRQDFFDIAKMDHLLREDIKSKMTLNISPTELGPTIMTSHYTNRLQLVAYNKSQAAIPTELDFKGHTIETAVFSNRLEDLNANLTSAQEFIKSLGSPTDTSQGYLYADRNFVWTGIEWPAIRDYMKNFIPSSREKALKSIPLLLDWFEKETEDGNYGKWNVILAGTGGKRKDNRWDASDGIAVNKIQRASAIPAAKDDSSLNIKTLRTFTDFLSDIKLSDDMDEKTKELIKTCQRDHTQSNLNELREQVGLSTTPQIVIYIVDKDSAPRKEDAKTRYPLNAKEDVAGFSINIPGHKSKKLAAGVTIDLNK